MSWPDNYPRMLLRNRATGYAICHCLLYLFRRRQSCNHGITEADITSVSDLLLISQQWVLNILQRYGLFYPTAEGYFPTEGWEEYYWGM